MTFKSYAKFEEKLTGGLRNEMRNLTIFTRTLESVKIGNLMGSFCSKQKIRALKFTEKLWPITLKNDEKIEEELTCCFKIEEFEEFEPNT